MICEDAHRTEFDLAGKNAPRATLESKLLDQRTQPASHRNRGTHNGFKNQVGITVSGVDGNTCRLKLIAHQVQLDNFVFVETAHGRGGIDQASVLLESIPPA